MDTAGHLIVSERGKGITGHELNADGCVTSSKTIIADNGPNHGIEFNPAGTQLYARWVRGTYIGDYFSLPPRPALVISPGYGITTPRP